MKVLLLGEFSGVNINLKQGLQQLGHDVLLAANGDGWKSVGGADTFLFDYSRETSFLEKISGAFINPLFDKRFIGYDVVQAISPCLYYYLLLDRPINNIVKNNDRFFVNAAGLDWFLYDAWRRGKYKKERYFLEDNPESQVFVKGETLASKCDNYTCRKIMKKADGIIPCIPFEYEIPYEGLGNLLMPIMFPINVDQYEYIPNITNGKVVFFHGINRIKDKGSNYIKDAMEQLQDKYPRDVECIIAERMPLAEYLETIKRANVIIDQCRTYGYGMNCCISMAKGKIVMSCAEDEFLKRAHIKRDECPIINIRPNSDEIVHSMEYILDNRKKIEEFGFGSRGYIEKKHHYISIAQEYVKTWMNKEEKRNDYAK